MVCNQRKVKHEVFSKILKNVKANALNNALTNLGLKRWEEKGQGIGVSWWE